MIKTLFEMFFKNYIDEQIDKRFTENMIERYWSQKQNETARRLQKARERHKIDYPASYEAELHTSEPRYCPVVTYDGTTPNPEYNQKPMHLR